MANKDLRDWIEGVKAAGELKLIKGAEPKEVIGGIVDIYMRKMGNPAVMFDEVPGYPKGHRVLANILTSVPRINIALGLPPQTTEIELTQWWRNYFKNAPSHPTKAVNGGPLLDNVPVAANAGMHPALVMLGGIEIPYGKNELEAAGGIFGEAVEVINMPKTGLPVPANAEIAFEGFIGPDDKIKEGPLGEWTGYYASGSDLEPAIRIDTLMYRNDPILVGAIPAVPPNDNTFYFGSYRCGAVWNQLEAAGIPGVQGVWTHESGGSRFMLVVSVKTLYGGHSKQAGMVAAHCHAGAYNNRWTIVVDDDIDPTNFNDVVWAMCTRCDPRDQVDIIHGGWSSALDPMCYDTESDRRNSRVVIDACIPFRRKKTFPKGARSSKAPDDRMRPTWAKA